MTESAQRIVRTGGKIRSCIPISKKPSPSTRRSSRKAPKPSSATTGRSSSPTSSCSPKFPTTYDKKEQRQVSSGNLLLRGVPGVGKTFFGVILAAISNAKFARLQGRADLQPTEVVGFQMINPATGELITEFGPLAEAEIILLDEINRIPLKSQSAFLEGLQDRTVTVGKTTYELPAFSFAIATMNPVELGQGTFPLSEAATDRFAIIVNIGYLPPEEERKLVNFDFKRIRLEPADGRRSASSSCAARSTSTCSCTKSLGDYIQRAGRRHAALQPRDRLAHALAVRARRARRRSRRVAARDHLLGPAGQGLGAAGAPPRRGLSRGHPGSGALRARPPHLARAARREPRPDDRSGHRRRRPAGADSVRTARPLDGDERDAEPLISLSDITEVELLILKRMREFTIGEHASRFHGSGFDFVGLREWQAGDRFSSIDWPQSSLTNFSPLIIREFEQPSTSSVVMVADRSLSTRCGIDGVPIATTIARAMATIGMSAVFFQDSVGLVTFDHEFSPAAGAAAAHRQGPGHSLPRRLPARPRAAGPAPRPATSAPRSAGFMRKTSMVPVISDFLFDNVDGAGPRAGAPQLGARRVSRASSTRRSRSSCPASRPAGSKRSTSRAAARA